MAEKRTRYNELLGVPNTIRDPDLYQLLGLDREYFDPNQVDAAYREQMSKLQKIRSPKHKSFIEFLKGELRRARTALSDERRRGEYDDELLDERREQLSRILDVVLSDGTLSETEEERIRTIGAEVGLFPDEVEWILDEELNDRGAVRGQGHDQAAAGDPWAPPLPGPPLPAGGSWSEDPGFFRSEPPRKAASQHDIQREIAKRMPGQRKRRPPPPVRKRPSQPPPEEIVTAELVEEVAPSRPGSEWGQTARPAKATGWGKAAVSKKVGVCAGCLGTVQESMLQSGKAERLKDGRLHCPACTNRLIAGLICATCYQRISRSEMKGGQLVIRKGRVTHGQCAG